MQKKLLFVSSVLIVSALCQYLPTAALANSTPSKSAKGSPTKSKRSRHSNRYSLVPPPPPTAVSPVVLAQYPNMGMHTGRFIPSKPRHLAEEMKLTAVMDDVAFFKVDADESIHLRQGKSYQTVKVAEITPEEVVLEEKGLQYVKRLR